MKLYYADPSPYSRKVRVVIREKRLESIVHEVYCNPYDDGPELKAVNPLRKIPALVTDHGTLFDSPVICAYLDGLNSTPRLIPQGDDRWPVLKTEALADGIMDALVAVVIERRRPPEKQSQRWQEYCFNVVRRCIEAIAEEQAAQERPFSLAHIAVASALGYADFRTPELDWRALSPHIAEWYEGVSSRPSFVDTPHPSA